jgi:hypothetical protein
MSAYLRSGPNAIWIVFATAIGLAGCDDQSGAPPPQRAQPPAMTRVIAPIDVTKVDLGRAVKPDNTISQPTASFKPTDTIFAAVTTERPGHDIKLKARWLFQDESVIKETTQTINPTDTLVTDFQVVNGAGWPVGWYKLEILINDEPDGHNHTVAVTQFEVRK